MEIHSRWQFVHDYISKTKMKNNDWYNKTHSTTNRPRTQSELGGLQCWVTCDKRGPPDTNSNRDKPIRDQSQGHVTSDKPITAMMRANHICFVECVTCWLCTN